MRGKAQRFDTRQVMRAQNFEIFHYRDSALKPVAIHHHDFYEVYFFLSGHVEYRVEGNVYRLEPGNLLLISPMELHQPVVRPNVEPYERIVLWIDREYLAGLSTGETSLSRCFDFARPGHTNLLQLTTIQRTAITAKLEELVREAHGADYGCTLWAGAAFLQLMVELNRISLQSAGDSAAQKEPSLVSRVLAYIGEYYDKPLTLDSLAAQFYVSKYHLAHAFQQSVGTSVYHYVLLKRLMFAKQLLNSGMPPGAVSQNCGFKDYANFYRAFRSEYGLSPREYQASER